MNENSRRIEQIKVENIVWIIYFFLIGLCLYANSLEKDYFLTGSLEKKESYRKITIFIFVVAVIIYLYFTYDNYEDYKSLGINDSIKKKRLTELSLFASSLVLISGLIFLYISIVDTELEIELAFN